METDRYRRRAVDVLDVEVLVMFGRRAQVVEVVFIGENVFGIDGVLGFEVVFQGEVSFHNGSVDVQFVFYVLGEFSLKILVGLEDGLGEIGFGVFEIFLKVLVGGLDILGEVSLGLGERAFEFSGSLGEGAQFLVGGGLGFEDLDVFIGESVDDVSQGGGEGGVGSRIGESGEED